MIFNKYVLNCVSITHVKKNDLITKKKKNIAKH